MRWLFEKYLASSPDGVTTTREIYYYYINSRRELLSRFDPNGKSRVHGSYQKDKDQHRAMIRFFFWKVNHALKPKSAWKLYMLTPLLGWRPSKIGLTIFNVVAYMFFMSHAQLRRKLLPRRIKCRNFAISFWQTADWRCAR